LGALIIFFIGMISYVHFTCDPACPECNPNCRQKCGNWFKSIGVGFFYTLCSLFVIGSMFSFSMEYWYKFKEKQENERN